MKKHWRDRARMFFVVILMTMIIYLYFFWVVFSFTRYIDDAVDDDDEAVREDRVPAISRRNYRNPRIFQHSPGPGSNSVTCISEACPQCRSAAPPPFSEVVMSSANESPPAYEEALKMQRVQDFTVSNNSELIPNSKMLISGTNDQYG